ncbi:hypothetical protein RFI_32946, partial [Reticulomyxa filosa]
ALEKQTQTAVMDDDTEMKQIAKVDEIKSDEIDILEFDHRDIFVLEACYDLNRLLPTQIEKLAKQRIRQLLNNKRPMSERETAAKRLTLLPSFTYSDIVEFLSEHKPKELGVKITEALIKGVMYGDDMLAPLHYLLTPEMLSSQQARVAAYAIPKCLSYAPHTTFTNIMKAVLTGERRTKMKITAYKQVIRMLTSNPTPRHLRMVLYEWKRKNLHRDVRIVILTEVFKILAADRPLESLVNTAWKILESCVNDPNTNSNDEIMIALIGRFNTSSHSFKEISFKPRILEHLDTFSSIAFKTEYRDRLRDKLLLVLVKRIYEIYFTKENPEETKKDKATEENEKKTKDKKDVANEKRKKKSRIAEDERLIRDQWEANDDNIEVSVDGSSTWVSGVISKRHIESNVGEFITVSYKDSSSSQTKTKEFRIFDTKHIRPKHKELKRSIRIDSAADMPYIALRVALDTISTFYQSSHEHDTGSKLFVDTMGQVSQDIVLNFDEKFLYHPKPDIRRIYEQRFIMAVQILRKLLGFECNRYNTYLLDEKIWLNIISTIFNRFLDRLEACTPH